LILRSFLFSGSEKDENYLGLLALHLHRPIASASFPVFAIAFLPHNRLESGQGNVVAGHKGIFEHPLHAHALGDLRHLPSVVVAGAHIEGLQLFPACSAVHIAGEGQDGAVETNPFGDSER